MRRAKGKGQREGFPRETPDLPRAQKLAAGIYRKEISME